MSKHRPHLTRHSADRVLDDPRGPVDDIRVDVGLAKLLAAATARDTATGELPGEAAALAQFRAASAHGLQPTVEEISRMTRLRRRIVAAPFAALGVAVAAVAGGGVAVAASQGAVHVPFTGHDNRSDHAPAAPAATNPGLTRSASAEPTDGATPTSHPSASPSPSLVGLCHAYLAGATHDGKTNPAFTALTSAAGSADNVRTYCVALLGTSHPAHPTHPVVPTQAASPTHPVHPSHPAMPSQAANSTHPVHPSHPAKPTQAANPTPPAGHAD